MKIDRFVSIIAPLHNDETIVASYIHDTIQMLSENYTNYELVLIDDGSEDGTIDAVTALLTEYKGIRLLPLSREFGEEIAIAAGLDSVIGDFAVVMLPHMDPPEVVPELVQRCIDGSDVVFGVRKSRKGESWLVSLSVAIFYWYCRKYLKLDLPKNSTQFRCMSRQAVNAIIQIRDSYRYLRLFSSYVGYDHQQFSYSPISRGGKTKPRKFFQSLSGAASLVMENSAHPLRIVSWLGLTAAIGNLVYVAYIFAVYFYKDSIAAGWTTLSLQNAGQFLMIIIILTALCEYTGRMLTRLRDRPLYYLRGERNSSVLLVDNNRTNIVEDSKSMDI